MVLKIGKNNTFKDVASFTWYPTLRELQVTYTKPKYGKIGLMHFHSINLPDAKSDDYVEVTEDEPPLL